MSDGGSSGADVRGEAEVSSVVLSAPPGWTKKAASAVGDALAILKYMLPKYKYILGRPSLKVDLYTVVAAEGILTFVISMAVLWIVVKGTANPIVKIWMLAVASIALVIMGTGFTGPSMNPTNSLNAHSRVALMQKLDRTGTTTRSINFAYSALYRSEFLLELTLIYVLQYS